MLEHFNQNKLNWLIFLFEFGSNHTSYCWSMILNFKSEIYPQTQEKLRSGVMLRLERCSVGSCPADLLDDTGYKRQSRSPCLPVLRRTYYFSHIFYMSFLSKF